MIALQLLGYAGYLLMTIIAMLLFISGAILILVLRCLALWFGYFAGIEDPVSK